MPEIVEQIEANAETTPDDEFDQFELNGYLWPVWEIFWSCRTQWRRVGMEGKYIGLDYPSVRSVLDLYGLDTPLNFERIQLLERGFLQGVNGQPL